MACLVAGVKVLLFACVWLLAPLWASAVFFVKMKFRKLGEEIDHYRAAHATLLCGIPYRRKRKQTRKRCYWRARVENNFVDWETWRLI